MCFKTFHVWLCHWMSLTKSLTHVYFFICMRIMVLSLFENHLFLNCKQILYLLNHLGTPWKSSFKSPHFLSNIWYKQALCHILLHLFTYTNYSTVKPSPFFLTWTWYSLNSLSTLVRPMMYIIYIYTHTHTHFFVCTLLYCLRGIIAFVQVLLKARTGLDSIH